MSFQASMDDLLAEFSRQRNSLAEMQTKTQAISVTGTSPRREVAVTVGHNGVVTDIQFPTGAFRRMTPGELSSALLTAYAEAKEKVTAQAADLLQPLLPDGADAGAIVRGTAQPDAILPGESSMPAALRDLLGLGDAPR